MKNSHARLFGALSARTFVILLIGTFFAFSLFFSFAAPAHALTYQEVDVICQILGCTADQKAALYALVSDNNNDGIEIDDFDTDTEIIFEADDVGEVSVGEFVISFDVSAVDEDIYLDKSTEEFDEFAGSLDKGVGDAGEGVVYNIDSAGGAVPDSFSAVLECVAGCGDASDNTSTAFFIEEGDTEEYRLTVTVEGDSSQSDDFKVYLESINWSLTSSPAADKFYTLGLGEDGDSDTGYLFLKSLGTGNGENKAPVFVSSHVIKPDNMNVGDVAVFIWKAEDPEGDGISWSVDWGDRTGQDGVTCPVPDGKGETFVASHSWKTPGEYSVEPFASDCNGNTTVGHGYTYRIVVGDDTSLTKIEVIEPKRGDFWAPGKQIVKWDTTNDIPSHAYMSIGVRNKETGRDYSLGNTRNDGYHVVAVPTSIPSGYYTLFIKTSLGGKSIHGWSDGAFEIESDNDYPVRVLHPNGGETFAVGGRAELIWKAQSDVDLYLAPLSSSPISETYVIAKEVDWENDDEQIYLWNVGEDYRGNRIPDGAYYLNVCPHGYLKGCDTSDGYFKIFSDQQERGIRVVWPNGGEKVYSGEPTKLQWRTTNIPSSARVTLRFRDVYGREHYLTEKGTLNDGYEVVTIPRDLAAGAYLFEAKTSYAGQSYLDASNGKFEVISLEDIEPKIKYISPTSGEPDESVAIYGTNLNNDGSEYIEIMGEKIGVHQTFSPYYRSDSKLKFYIPSVPVGHTYAIRVGQKAGEMSNWVTLKVDGEVEENTISITNPNGGDRMARGTRYQIRWDSFGKIPRVDIFLSSQGGSNCTGLVCTNVYYPAVRYDIAPGISNIGSFTMAVGSDYNGRTIPDGSYTLEVCDSTGEPCDSEYVRIESFVDTDSVSRDVLGAKTKVLSEEQAALRETLESLLDQMSAAVSDAAR